MAQIQASRIRFICSRHVFFGNSVELMEKFIFPRRSKLLNFFPAVFSSFFFSPNPIQLCSPPFRFACMPFSDLFSSLFFRGPFLRASWQPPPWIASRSNFSWRKMIWEKALSREMYQKVFQSAFQTENVPDYAIYNLLSPGKKVEIGGLASTIRADKTRHCPGLDAQRNPVDRPNCSKNAGQVAGRQNWLIVAHRQNPETGWMTAVA